NAAAFAVDGLSVLRVQRCLTRSMSVAHEPAEVQAVVVSNLAPALASLVHCHEVIEGEIRPICSKRISQQVRVLQFSPAKPGRCPLRLQSSHGNARLVGDSRHDCSVGSNSAEHEKECRCN